MLRSTLEARRKKLGWAVLEVEGSHRYWWHPNRDIVLAVPYAPIEPGDDELILDSIGKRILADAER